MKLAIQITPLTNRKNPIFSFMGSHLSERKIHKTLIGIQT